MGEKEIFSQLGSSLTGNVESAYFIIYDFRNMSDTLFSLAEGGGAVNDTARAGKSDELVKAAYSSFKNNIASKDSLLNSTKTLKSMSGGGGNTKIYRLQFNPSSFQVYASSPSVSRTDATGKPNAVDAAQSPGLTMSTSFIFDEMTTLDCFPGDKFDGGLLNPTSLVKNLVNAGKQSGKNGKKNTVRPTTEAFLAALRNPFTRTLSFRWTDFVFTGELLSVGATYSMFNPQGEPVRAEVSMRIQQKINDTLLKSWYDAFDTVVGAKSAVSASGAYVKNLASKRQSLGSIFNVSL